MEFRDFTAGKDDDGRRLDRLLRIFLKDLSLGEIYKLLRKGLIKVNDSRSKADYHIKPGDKISIAGFLFEDKNKDYSGKNETKADNKTKPDKLNIVFENENLLIIDKPYGVPVHGSKTPNSQDLAAAVSEYYKKSRRKTDSLSFRPGPLHRLDRNTTGLLVFSMSLEGARWFSESIKNHTVQKKYLGLAQGKLEKNEVWEDKLSDCQDEKKTFHTVIQDINGHTAITKVTPLAHGFIDGQEVTLIEYDIKTGRKHQIRAQSKIHGYPLAGDTAYGAKKIKAEREYFLQAFSLSFPKDNPLGLPCEIKIGLSPDFYALLQYCEIKNPGL